MEVTRAYKFRIYPDVKRQKEIDERLALAQQFYNKLLEKSIQAYKSGNGKISMAQLNRFVKEIIQEDKKYLKLYSQTRCEIEYRILKAYRNFFRRVKEKKEGKKVKAGFPRFKSLDRYKSITYPQDNGSFSIEKERKKRMLRISGIGRMQIELHRPIEGKIKTLTIKKKAGGYYAIFTIKEEIEAPKVEDTNPIGIDLGLHSFITTSSGMKVEKPKFIERKAKHIAKWQKKIARRKKGSKRRDKAKQHLQKEWEQATNQSEDFAHKLANKLVNSGFTSFAVEDLHIQIMAKNHSLAEAIYAASWNKFLRILSYKAESAGMKVIKVDPRDTTQECSRCGHIKTGDERLGLSERLYHCSACGLTMDRDENAARVMLKRATLGQRGSYAQGESVRPQQEAVLEELRTDKIHPLHEVSL